MPSIIISKEARQDLLSIHAYIRDDLANPEAARETMKGLKSCIHTLSHMPERGKPLDAVLPLHTDFRFLVHQKYKVFYLFDGNKVEVLRILHTLQNHLQALFP